MNHMSICSVLARSRDHLGMTTSLSLSTLDAPTMLSTPIYIASLPNFHSPKPPPFPHFTHHHYPSPTP